jgi:hypothetical protein
MAPREAEFTELIQKLIQQQEDLLSEKRKAKIHLVLAIGIPAGTILLAAMAFYFNTQSDIHRIDRELSELKTTVTAISTQDRQRLIDENAKLNRELEKLHP